MALLSRIASYATSVFVVSVVTASASSAAVSPAGETAQPVDTNRLLSKTSDGSVPQGDSLSASTTSDGRYVAFESDAPNLVEGVDVPPGIRQIYVRDRRTGTTVLATQTKDGEPGNDQSEYPAIAPDGRYVVFESAARNLAGGDDDEEEIFRVDLRTMTTTLVTQSLDGNVKRSYRSDISADGRLVTYETESARIVHGDRNHDTDVFLYDFSTGDTVAVSHAPDGGTADGSSFESQISADGSTVVFTSNATDIVDGQTGIANVIAYDVATGVNRRVTNGNKGSYPEGISANGTHVVFRSAASDLLPGVPEGKDRHAYLADLMTGDLLLVDHAPDGEPGNGRVDGASVSDDGSLVAFDSTSTNVLSDDREGGLDVYLLDVVSDTVTLVSHRLRGASSADGMSARPSIAGDGSYVCYQAYSTNLVKGLAPGFVGLIGYRVG